MQVPKIRQGFAVNLVGMGIPVIISLLTIPLYITHVGEARYGILSIIWLLLGYMGFLDLGLSRATANAMARLADASMDERSRVLTTALRLNLSLGLFGGVLLFVGGHTVFFHVVDLPPELGPEIAGAMPWLAATLPLALVLGVGIGTLESRERFIAANLLQTGGVIAGQVTPVLVAMWISPRLDLLVAVSFAARLLTVLAVFAVVAGQERLRFRGFDRREGGKLLRYGGWVSASSVISPILASLDQVLIGSQLGPAAVAHYAVPMNLAVRAQLLAAALARTLFPRLSRVDAVAAVDLSQTATTALAYGFGAMSIFAMLVVEPFLILWIGADFAADATPVAHVLILGTWINGLAFIPLNLLQAQGRPAIVAKLHAAELLPFVGLLWLLVTEFGLVGAALAWTVRVTADAALLFWFGGLGPRRLWRILPPAGILLAGYGIAGQEPSPVLALAMGLGLSLVIIVTGLVLDRTLRGLAMTAWSAVTRRNAG